VPSRPGDGQGSPAAGHLGSWRVRPYASTVDRCSGPGAGAPQRFSSAQRAPLSAGRRQRMHKCQTPSGNPSAESGGLFRHADHLVDSRLHQIIRQIGATTLGGHHTGASLEALERMVIEDILALGDARSPR
jgi:hypothetical protein